MKVGDWVMARKDEYEPNAESPWVAAILVDKDDSSIPWCVYIPNDNRGRRQWRYLDRVRPPENDEDWALIAAQILIGERK